MGILIRFRGKRGQETKFCPECRETLPIDCFWSDLYRADGLFAYCKNCNRIRKRRMREQKREAMARIVAAGERCAAGARAWDQAVGNLVTAWREMFEADIAMRTSRYDAGIDVDGGRIEIRLIHPRALYTLGLALQEANCPWPTPLLKTEQMLTTLAEYVGDAPQQDYVGAKENGEDGQPDELQEGRPEGGQTEGRAQQDHARPAPDGAKRAGRRGRPRLSPTPG